MTRKVHRGALIYPVSLSTGRVLLGLRSALCNEPHTWAGFKGSAERGEDPATCALRELEEETGYSGPIALYRTAPTDFIGVVPDEFVPVLTWEHDDARWFTPAELGWPDLVPIPRVR